MPKMRALNSPKPSDCKAGARKKPSPLGEGGRREPDGRGELAYKYRLRPNRTTKPSDCKAGARKSRPPWGKVAGVSLTEGGNSLTNIDCPTTNAPSTITQTNPHYTRKAIQFRKRAPPLRALTGPPPTQRGRLIQFQYLLYKATFIKKSQRRSLPSDDIQFFQITPNCYFCVY